MSKGIMTDYVCAVCSASWCSLIRSGRPSKFCGQECARAAKTAKQKARREARRAGTPLEAPTRPYWGPSAAVGGDLHAGAVGDFLGVMDGAYLIDGDTSWGGRDNVPDDARHPGIAAGPNEGRTASRHLRVIGSNRPWHECQ